MHELRLVANDRLFLPMLLSVERGDRILRLCDESLELRRLMRQTRQRIAIRGHLLAELLDFALGLEDPARFRLAAA